MHFFCYDTHRKGWRCMDLETKMVIVSRDVVFDEISSYKDDAEENIEFPIATDIQAEENIEATTNIEFATRKNLQRQKKLPGHLSDFVVDINQFSVLSCFFLWEIQVKMSQSCTVKLKEFQTQSSKNF